MKKTSFSLRMAIGLITVIGVGAAPFVFHALRASEATLPAAAIAGGEENSDRTADPIQLALAPPAKSGEEAKPKAPASSTDPYAIPEGSVDELIDFIIQVQKTKPRGNSEEAQLEHANRVASAVVAAAEKILTIDPSDEQARAATRVAFQALWHLVSIDDETAGERIDALVAKLKDDKRPGLADMSLENSLLRRTQAWDNPSEEAQAQFVADMKSLLSNGPLSQEKLQMAMGVAEMLEQMNETHSAAAVYEALIAALPKTEQAQEFVERMEATVRRLKLPGNFMEIAGTTLDGQAFDWDAYRGKVVLVDFWATWCGPCIRELPNVIENYRKFHAKGFDVVGISLDDDTEKVEEFITKREIPWVTLIDKDPKKRGWNSPLANQYGISGIPAAILVDREGKVVSLAAHGEELTELLEKLLGDAK